MLNFHCSKFDSELRFATELIELCCTVSYCQGAFVLPWRMQNSLSQFNPKYCLLLIVDAAAWTLQEKSIHLFKFRGSNWVQHTMHLSWHLSVYSLDRLTVELAPTRVTQGIQERFDTCWASMALQIHREHILLIALIASFWLAPLVHLRMTLKMKRLSNSIWLLQIIWPSFSSGQQHIRLRNMSSFPCHPLLPLQLVTDMIIIMLLCWSLLLHNCHRHTDTSCVILVWVMFCFHERTVAFIFKTTHI